VTTAARNVAGDPAAPAALLSTTDARLQQVAERVRTLGFRIVRLNTSLTGEHLSQTEFRHHAEAALWETFQALGGDWDQPDTFPWDRDVTDGAQQLPMTEYLTRRTVKRLRAILIGRDTTYGDTAIRMASRKNRVMVDQYQWSAWRYATALGASGGRTTRQQPGTVESQLSVVTEYEAPTPQDERLEQRELLTLPEQLRQALSPREFKWLVERVIHGRPESEQIAELQAENAKYQGEGGYGRAQNLINVTVHRAKAKARKALGGEASAWADLARAITG
jgi:hypothetical protein